MVAAILKKSKFSKISSKVMGGSPANNENLPWRIKGLFSIAIFEFVGKFLSVRSEQYCNFSHYDFN